MSHEDRLSLARIRFSDHGVPVQYNCSIVELKVEDGGNWEMNAVRAPSSRTPRTRDL